MISKLVKFDLVEGLPNIKFEKDKLCDACQEGKQVRISFKSKDIVSTTKPLEFHIDLFGPTRTLSLGGKRYNLVIVNDYSRYTWVMFLATKDETYDYFSKLCRKIQNKNNLKILSIRSDRGNEFHNQDMEFFCNMNGIDHNFSAPRTPQQNGVVGKKIEH